MDTSEVKPASPNGPFPTGQAHRLYILAMIFLPILSFAGIEQYLRLHGYQHAYGWTTFNQMSNGKNNRFVFIGSSRTASAVDETVFYQEIGKYVDTWYYGQNMGAGASKMPFHHFGTRNVFNETPDCLAGTVFLVEASSELPDYTYWTDRWWYPAYEGAIIQNFRRQDIRPLWEIDIPSADRLDMTMRYLYRDVTFLNRRETVRHDTFAAGTRIVRNFLINSLGVTPPVEEYIDPIKTAGGVIEASETRKQATEKFDQFLQQEKEYLNRPWNQWDKTVLNDFIEMVYANGGKVVFYDVPQPSRYETEIYRTPQRVEDREAFRRQREIWGTPYIKADFDYQDDDFPDHFHLALKHTEAYSRALAQEYLRVYLRPPRYLEAQAAMEAGSAPAPGNP